MNAPPSFGREIVPYNMEHTNCGEPSAAIGTKRIILKHIEVLEDGHQAVVVTDDDPLSAQHIIAKREAAQMVGRFEANILSEMCEESHSELGMSSPADELDTSLYDDQVQGKQVMLYGSEDTKNEETSPAAETRRLKFDNISAATGAVQAVVTCNSNAITAEDIHCRENAMQITGHVPGGNLLGIWRGGYAASRKKRENAKASATKSFRKKFSFSK